MALFPILVIEKVQLEIGKKFIDKTGLGPKVKKMKVKGLNCYQLVEFFFLIKVFVVL